MTPGRVRAVERRIFANRKGRGDISSTARGLTPRTPHQLRIARFMREYHAKYGYWPLLSDIAEFMGISKVTVHEHLKSLVTQGVVIRNESKRSARAYAVADGVTLPNGGPTRSELVKLLRDSASFISGNGAGPASYRNELIARLNKAIESEGV